MFRAIDLETGGIVYLVRAMLETDCPECGKGHTVNLEKTVQSIMEHGSTWKDFGVYCTECSAKRRVR